MTADHGEFFSRYGGDKILHPDNIDRLVEWMEGKNIPPVTVMICPTDRCNHLCPRCVGGRLGVQKLAHMEGIVDQLADYGVKSLVVSGGGEPLINPDTPRMIEHARERGLDIGLLTNGSVSLSEEKMMQLVSSCNWIRVSIDASNPEEYKHTHGMEGKAFERMLSNLKRLTEVRDKYGLTNCDIGTGYLTDEVTRKGMVRATRICRDMGLGFIQFRPFFRDETQTDEEFAKCLQYATPTFRVLRSEYRYDRQTIESGSRGYKKCLSPNFETSIAATGKVYICCHTIGEDNHEIGNINQSRFKDIWESEAKKQHIDAITFEGCPPICKWHVLNNVLYGIKSQGITTQEVKDVAESRKDEIYRTAKIL